MAIFHTGAGEKGTASILVDFMIYKLAFISFVMTPGAQTLRNIAVYASAKQLVIKFMVLMANPAQFWGFAMAAAFSSVTA